MGNVTAQDYFYVCPIHLKDKGFCSPVVEDEGLAEKRRKEEFEREIEKVKKEYEEKMKKKGKKKEDESKKDAKDDAKNDDTEGNKAEKEKEEKVCRLEPSFRGFKDTILTAGMQIKSIKAASTTGKATSAAGNVDNDMPRIYTLHKYAFPDISGCHICLELLVV